MNKTKEIKKEIWVSKERKQAQKVSRRNLEDFYLEEKWSRESGMSDKRVLYTVLITLIAVLLLTTIIIGEMHYANTEDDNYNAFARDICESQEDSKYRSFEITKTNIIIHCENGEYYLPVIRY